MTLRSQEKTHTTALNKECTLSGLLQRFNDASLFVENLVQGSREVVRFRRAMKSSTRSAGVVVLNVELRETRHRGATLDVVITTGMRRLERQGAGKSQHSGTENHGE